MATDEPPEIFHHYRILRREDGSLWELGRGAMGVTYKAEDTNLRTVVALKVINALYLHKSSARERFIREARAAASLRHRNVAAVHHLGQDEQSFFYAMEFIDGRTMENFVAHTGPRSWRDALGYALQVTRALMAAHAQHLVHRDLKPANLMLVNEAGEDELVVKVIDFGLAKSIKGLGNAAASVSSSGTGFVGTPLFASPEQCEEISPDIRSDIYSLGVVLWYTLTGKPLFVGPVGKIFAQHLTAEPPWKLLPADLPDPVRLLLTRMLAKDRADRPQTPADLRQDIERCLHASDGPSTTVPTAAAPAKVPAAPVRALPVENLALALARPPAYSGLSRERGRSLSLADFLSRSGGRVEACFVADLLDELAAIVKIAANTGLDLTTNGIRFRPEDEPASGAAYAVPFSHPLIRSVVPVCLEVRAQVAEEAFAAATLTEEGGTLVSEAAEPSSPCQPVAALAALAYELLGGIVPPATGGRYRALRAYDKTINNLLRKALEGKSAAGRGAGEFVEKLGGALRPPPVAAVRIPRPGQPDSGHSMPPLDPLAAIMAGVLLAKEKRARSSVFKTLLPASFVAIPVLMIIAYIFVPYDLRTSDGIKARATRIHDSMVLFNSMDVDPHDFLKVRVLGETAKLRRSPNNPILYQSRAMMFLDLEMYDRAVEDFSEAIRLSPGDGGLYHCRADAYRKTGDNKAADKDELAARRLLPPPAPVARTSRSR